MEGLLDLFECVIESPRHGEYLQEFLKSCTEHQAFYKKKSNVLQPFVSFTNSKLNTPSERLEGLLLLKTFLPQCSDEQFLDNAISWMHQCVKGIESSKCLETNNAAFSVLKILLEMASSFQELTKGIANSVNAKFAEQLKLAYKKLQVRLSALQCVQTMIRNYGAPCTPHKTVIENFVLYDIDSKDISVVSAASRCFALLPLIGGAGSHGANHKTRWLEQQRRTCGTLQQLLDQLLDGVNEVETFARDESSEILPLECVTDTNPVVRIHEIANRFVNIAKFLEAMLLNEFPVSKSVLPDTIINIVCRGLSVNCGTLGSKGSSDMLTVGSVLPRVHVALLRVLNSLIVCLGKNLYPQAKLICRLVLQTLKWTATSNRDYAAPRPYSALRAEACRTLVAWLRVAKAGSCVEATADELVQALLQDVSSEKTAVKLNIQGGKKNKKRKHNASAEETALTPQPAGVGTSTRIKLANPSANDKTCHAALDALYWLVHAAGVLVKPTLHKLLQETVLVVLFDIQRSARNDLPVPYSKVECRLSLYKLLQALTLDPHPMWPPPTQFALHVLARGQTDPSCQVSGFCTVALCSVEKLIHSSSQALQFPISLEEVLKGVNMDELSAVRLVAERRLSEEPDAMSVTSRQSSVNSGPSCPSPDLESAGAVFTVPTQASSSKDNTITSTTHDDALSDASTVVFPGGGRVGSQEERKDVTESPQKKDHDSASVPRDFSDLEDELSETGHHDKRLCTDQDGSSTKDVVVDQSNLNTPEESVATDGEKVTDNLVTDDLITDDLVTDDLITDDLITEDLVNTTVIHEVPNGVVPNGVVPTSETKAAEETVPQSPLKGKLFQGKFCNMTSPKLLGGGEVSKVTRFDLKPRFVNLADDDDGSVVNLSSDEEFHESNISVVSSNSNYQESILNKSGITADGDIFEDLEEENDEETAMSAHNKIPENGIQTCTPSAASVVGKSHEEISSQVDAANDGGASSRSREDDDEEGILIVDFELSNGTSPGNVAPRGDADDWEEPSSKRLKRDADVEGKEATVDNFEGMSDAEVVQTLLEDFEKKLDE